MAKLSRTTSEIVILGIFSRHEIPDISISDTGFSRDIEVAKLSRTTSEIVILGIFSRHEIPDISISDTGPQYATEEFEEFANPYDFTHMIVF